MDSLIQLVSYLIVTSIAAERVTDMVKRTKVLDFLSTHFPLNLGLLCQITSGLTGGLLCYFGPPSFEPLGMSGWPLAVMIGLASSGGSSVWSDLLQVLSAYRKGVQASGPTT